MSENDKSWAYGRRLDLARGELGGPSGGEARRLAKDSELGAVIEYNQFVARRATVCIIGLLGRLLFRINVSSRDMVTKDSDIRKFRLFPVDRSCYA
jgi:hypothetical protein